MFSFSFHARNNNNEPKKILLNINAKVKKKQLPFLKLVRRNKTHPQTQ
jgi:hypothetical protein